jgi:hypothetical protein
MAGVPNGPSAGELEEWVAHAPPRLPANRCNPLQMRTDQRKDESAAWRERLAGERRVLVDLVLAEAERLDGTDEQRKLRRAFITYRYAAELDAWKYRRNRFRLIFFVVTVGTAALGVINSGLVTASAGKRSTITDVILVTIGVLVAVFAAVNSFLNPGQAAAEYRNDEFELRRLGWEYLSNLESGHEPRAAYVEFKRAATEVLDRPHVNWIGRTVAPPQSGSG